jgi:outer membrane lipoprotein SlyB
MKRLFVMVGALTVAVSSPVYAKGCIKGAIVGGVAGSAVGHGKLGAAAGCVVGHHEANKNDSVKSAPSAPAQPTK